MGHVNLIRTTVGVVCHPKVGLDSHLCATFDDSSFSRSTDIITGPKISNELRDPDHATFKADLSSVCWDLI